MVFKVIFWVSPNIQLLDLAGAVQVFQESALFGRPYHICFLGPPAGIISAPGLGLNLLKDLNTVIPEKEDIIIIPGISMPADHAYIDEHLIKWLKLADQKKASICSICTGAFILAKSGLLNNKNCTTHWRFTDMLQKEFPSLKVQTDKLYVKDDNIYTSAGIATGIDLALFLLEERHGIGLAMKVAKEMVVYLRRDGSEKQQSVYLQYRDHKDEAIHKIQDWMINHLQEKISLNELAKISNYSRRNLTRIFKEKTGLTVLKYMTMIRAEKAANLLSRTDYKLEYIAKICGYKSTKQLKNILASINTPVDVS